MSEPESIPPRWAAHLKLLFTEMGSCRDPSASEPLRRKAWQILSFTLLRYLRYHSARLGTVSPEDIEDIASQKSLELIGRGDMFKWRMLDLKACEIPGFVSTVARNGLLDFLKTRGRWVRPSEDQDLDVLNRTMPYATSENRPDTKLESSEFARALRKCVEALAPRSRIAWFLRVFYDMPSKQIAAHPGVGLKSSHVDVVLQRSRDAVRGCMGKKGFEPEDMPPGTFVEMWRLFNPTRVEQTREAM